MNELLEAALEYARMGFFVLPLNETVKTKMPRVKWKYRRDQRPDEAEIQKWWRQWPNANVGLAVGKYSGVDVLDCDGAGVVEQVEAATGVELDRTYSVSTGRTDGGTHIYFQHNPDNNLKNWAKVIPGISVDVRTTDGIVAAPPSVHHTGTVYRWNNRKPYLNGATFPQMPPQVISAMAPSATKGPVTAPDTIDGREIPEHLKGRAPIQSHMGPPPSTLDEEAIETGVPEGQRDQLVFQLLCSLRARGVAYDDALQQAYDLGARCDPPFPREEVVTKIDHVWSSYAAGSATAANTPPEQALSRLQEVLDWVDNTDHPQHGWLDRIQGLIPEDINVVMDRINAKTNCGKRALQRSLNHHNNRGSGGGNAHAEIRKLNERYGWTTIGTSAYIVDTKRSDKLKIITSRTFMEQYSNQRITLPPATPGGEARSVPLGKAWIESPERRDFNRIYFHPTKVEEGSYNLYKGFAVQPAEVVDFQYIEKYMWHVDNVICSNKKETKDYVWAWAADMYQHPEDKKGVALVLRSGKGTGKGFFAEGLMKLWGPHAMNIINPSQFTGRFNVHLANKILLYIDEAFWTHDQRKAEGVVKGMITEQTIPVEGKGVDVILLENFNKFIMASNSEWAVPATFDERRFCCIDVNPIVTKNYSYFENLRAEMGHPMFAPTLLRYLLDYQYDPVSVRQPPSSDALTDQKLKNLGPVQEWWFEYLQKAESIQDWVRDGSIFKVTSSFYQEYINWCQDRNRHRETLDRFVKTVLGKDSLCPSAERRQDTDEKRQWGYLLPSIETCRKEFEDKVGGSIDWER